MTAFTRLWENLAKTIKKTPWNKTLENYCKTTEKTKKIKRARAAASGVIWGPHMGPYITP